MTTSDLRFSASWLAIALTASSTPALAQHAGHVAPPPPQEAPEHAADQQDPHAGHVMPEPQPAHEDAEETTTPAQGHQTVDHAAMGHAAMEGIDHSTMQGMDHAAASDDLPAGAPPRDPIPVVTPADRIAAFPDVGGHAVHDNGIHYFTLIDRLETWDADEGSPLAWEASGWVGTDLDRLWWRSEGEAIDGTTEDGTLELFYGRAIARWWDAVVGVRHDIGEGPSRTFAALGVIGLSPYKFEVEATAYLGQGGQTGLGLEAEYDTLLTNRLILQWLAEAQAWGEDDPRHGVGSGLSTLEAGLRLRYEVTRRFAPYIGIVHERAFGGTADLRRAEFDSVRDTRIVAGLRLWF
jgi:copper resistance protein B